VIGQNKDSRDWWDKRSFSPLCALNDYESTEVKKVSLIQSQRFGSVCFKPVENE